MAGNEQGSGSMLRFYWRLVRRTPVLLWEAGDRVVTTIGLVAATALALNREWSAAVAEGVQGISPAWGFVPVVVLFAYGLLRANYEEAQRLEAFDPHRETGVTNLADWLGRRVREVRALQDELEALGPPSPAQHAAVRGVESSLAHVNNEVRSRLVVAAPQWVEFYRQMPDWYQEHMLLNDGEREQLHRLLDYTADQLNRIREDQR